MPREISAPVRRRLEQPSTNEYLVVLLEITHASLAIPIRVANDIVSYVYNGGTYLGFPFEIELVGDVEKVPRGRIRIQNVDRRVGEAIRELTSSPNLTITILASSDFDTAVAADGTRSAIGTPIVEYQANHLIFGNISIDAMAISGEIISYDFSNEPWPAVRTTAERLPGLDP
jgi:Domain of unknown function (DUF1833)